MRLAVRVPLSLILRILTLNSDVKSLLERGDIELGHAKVLLALEGSQQSVVAKIVVAKGLSVRETEHHIHQLQNEKLGLVKLAITVDPDIRALQQRLSAQLGAQVVIQMQSKGKGKLLITYNSLDELDGILAHIS
jgi:ParB family transcriptional regulator, chromosome partitioning protein